MICMSIYTYIWDVRNKNPRPKQDESNSFAALAERGLDGTTVWLGQGVIHHFTTYSMLPPSWEIHWRQVNCKPQREKQFLAQWRHMIRGFFHGFSRGSPSLHVSLRFPPKKKTSETTTPVDATPVSAGHGAHPGACGGGHGPTARPVTWMMLERKEEEPSPTQQVLESNVIKCHQM
jgi:hypothetical protein